MNLRHALRVLFKAPSVTIIATLSLALGIGATTAIYSLFDQMILRALPVKDPGRLVNLVAPGPRPGGNSSNQAGDVESVFSYPMFRDLERVQSVFTGIAAHRLFGANLAYQGQTMGGDLLLVSGSYFPTCSSHARTSPICCWRARPRGPEKWPCGCRLARAEGISFNSF
jgi:hypothetical protein